MINSIYFNYNGFKYNMCTKDIIFSIFSLLLKKNQFLTKKSILNSILGHLLLKFVFPVFNSGTFVFFFNTEMF